jgi:soluble calcium-activated nucleotidase 1
MLLRRGYLHIVCSFMLASRSSAQEACPSYCPCTPASKSCCEGRENNGFGAPSGAAPMYYEHSVSRVLNTRPEYLSYVEAEYNIGVVADLDLMSRDPQEFIWRSFLKKGRLIRLSKRDERDRFTLAWDEELELRSSTATRNRSMELSELVRYSRNLIAFCDYSGIAYKIDPVTGKTFQRWAIADGDGDEPKPFKGEWATIKDDAIWLGSIGFEWYGPDGTIKHRNPEWVKTIDSGGVVRNLNWHAVYQTVRSHTNTTLPGYLWHEAVEWEPFHKRWVMLPRFASNTSKYVPGQEHLDTTNMLIVADESFTSINVIRLAHHDHRYGFTSVKRLPGSQRLFMALRVSETEKGDRHHTQATIIDLDGNFYMDPPYIEVGSRKFEGLAFL